MYSDCTQIQPPDEASTCPGEAAPLVNIVILIVFMVCFVCDVSPNLRTELDSRDHRCIGLKPFSLTEVSLLVLVNVSQVNFLFGVPHG